MKGKFILVVKVQQPNAFAFTHHFWHIDSNPHALPLASLQVNEYDIKHFEFSYTKANSEQTLQQIAAFCFKGLQRQLAPQQIELLELWEKPNEGVGIRKG